MAIKVVEEKRKVPDFAELAGDAQEMVLDKDIEEEDAVRLAAREPAKLSPQLQQATAAPPPKDLDSEIADLRALLERKLIEKANKAEESKEAVKAPTKAPAGMLWVFNRAPVQFEWQYDAVAYQIEGHDMALFPERIARHGRKRSILSLDPFTNKAVYKLALEGEAKFGVPLKVVNRIELLDRSLVDNLLPSGRGPGKTHSAVVTVDGMADMLSRRQSEFAELE